MITRFHATGASAGTAKWSNELSIPTTTPDRASSTTIGNISRDSCDREVLQRRAVVEARREHGS